ncbi:hypothetical protein [Ancylobacter terrae]|uniref:hypothetical protein n=1 Tax=Ancylobacter sp. sgz301288 TaxID=3342077 RepID=UPI003859BCDD
MPAADAALTIGEILQSVGSPVVEVACDEPIDSLARLMTFAGLPAVLLVRPCGTPERILSVRDVALALVDTGAGARRPLRRCGPEECFFRVARSILDEDQAAVLVERGRDRLALVTVDDLADYLRLRDDRSGRRVG